MPGSEPMVNSTKIQDGQHFETSAAKPEDMQPVENHEKPKVSTLVFMDLETTGLPSDVGKKNVQITEMCMVAMDRHSFETDGKLRVINKISLCIRPRFQISPGSMMITGLYNDILENQEEFDDSVPKLLEYFFRRLQKPICLLAHNGNRFDFPVLQAELNRINYTLGSDVVCADTLIAFRAICLLEKQAVAAKAEKEAEKEELYPEIVPAKNTPICDDDIEFLLSQDLESFACIDDALISLDEKDLKSGLTETEDKPEIHTTAEKESVNKEFLSPSQNEKNTPKKQCCIKF